MMRNGLFKILRENYWLVTASIWVVGLVFAFVNLYTASKLSPLTSNISIIQDKVNAIELQHEKITPQLATEKQAILDIETRLDRIQTTQLQMYGILTR